MGACQWDTVISRKRRWMHPSFDYEDCEERQNKRLKSQHVDLVCLKFEEMDIESSPQKCRKQRCVPSPNSMDIEKLPDIPDDDKSVKKPNRRRRENRFQIFVKSLSGKTLTISCKPTDTVAYLKQIISEREGLDLESGRLIWAGKQLQNHRSLYFYNIHTEATLFLVWCLPGGLQQYMDFLREAYRQSEKKVNEKR